MRTTLDLDNSVLEQLKQRQLREKKSLGQLASELLATALAQSEQTGVATPLTWNAQPMVARVDLEDRDALHRILDTDR
jgi:hypothetical protein